MKNAINKLQSDVTEQKTITDVISEENQKIKKLLDEKSKEIKLIQLQGDDNKEYLSSILSLLYENSGDTDSRENEMRGD